MIEYQTGDYIWRTIFRWQGSVIPHAFVAALPSTVIAFMLAFYKKQQWWEDNWEESKVAWTSEGTAYTALTIPVVALIGWRTNQALARFWEGTSLLHAMRGEWFDSASCLATFSMTAKKDKPTEVTQFRQTLLRLFSLCHGSALDEIRSDDSEDYEVLDFWGLDDSTLKIIGDCKKHQFNRVEVILHMIQVLVIDASERKIINVPPPILSRVYQTLSRGFVHLLSAKKIRDTRYPFPYAQLISVLLVVLSLTTPLAMPAVIKDPMFATISTFMPLFGLFALNYIAEELEMPYGDDSNDLPLDKFQKEMNSSLLMLIHDCSDHIASCAARAKTSYEGLSDALQGARTSQRNRTSVDAPGRRQSMFDSAVSLLSKESHVSSEVCSKFASLEEEEGSPRPDINIAEMLNGTKVANSNINSERLPPDQDPWRQQVQGCEFRAEAVLDTQRGVDVDDYANSETPNRHKMPPGDKHSQVDSSVSRVPSPIKVRRATPCQDPISHNSSNSGDQQVRNGTSGLSTWRQARDLLTRVPAQTPLCHSTAGQKIHRVGSARIDHV